MSIATSTAFTAAFIFPTSVNCGLFMASTKSKATIESGLDPAEYFRIKRLERRRKMKRPGMAASASSSASKKAAKIPRAEFLIPEKYEPPPPDCHGGNNYITKYLKYLNSLIIKVSLCDLQATQI